MSVYFIETKVTHRDVQREARGKSVKCCLQLLILIKCNNLCILHRETLYFMVC